ncbi:MAG: methyltransferase domain-containing protein [Elusimicrobia bacterium]|nr:methyltransferase domain-containing protein [Elusimicrobiota bacterium]
MLLRNKKNITSNEELTASYDRLYEGFLKENSTVLEAEFMLSMLKFTRGQTLLDVSSGKGDLVAAAQALGLEAVGIELSRTAIALANQSHPHCKFLHANAESLPFPTGSFDFVMNLGSLEHYLDPQKAALEMARVLKPMGRAVILLPNSHDILTFYQILVHGKGPDDLQDFERFASRMEWSDFLSQNGFEILETHKFDRELSRKPFRLFNFAYNALMNYIPLNLSRVFVFVCGKKTPTSA